MKVFITGGAGFIGSHAAAFYARRGEEVIAFDNFSRSKLLGYPEIHSKQNFDYLSQFSNVERIMGDILDVETLRTHIKDADLVIHTAAQTAVTASLKDPVTDFSTNALGTLNVLEAVRFQPKPPAVIFCSTNKVYGDNVNLISLKENKTRYEFDGPSFQSGINETFNIDLCGHTPYGCSKLSADLYMQDYAHRHGLKIGVFRLSCIYGPRQFGVEDQGWLAWFTIATHTSRPIYFYGNGKQTRDVLFISDLLEAFHAFELNGSHGVFNLGGGVKNTLSLVELVALLEKLTGKKSQLQYAPWRPDDQKVYISDIGKAKAVLGWSPKVSIEEGVAKLIEWVKENEHIFSENLLL